MNRPLAIALSALALTLSLSAQQAKVLAPHRHIPKRINKKVDWSKKATARSMIGGLWMTDANYKSSVYVRNVVESDPVTITPVLWLANGTKYTLPDVTIEPAGTAIIDINAGLQSKGISPWATLNGYVELQYSWPWDPLCATIRAVDVAHSLIYTTSLRSSTPFGSHPQAAASAQQTVEGMWWKEEKDVTGFVTLANVTSQPVQATVQVSDNQANGVAQHTVTISAHGMKMVNLTELPSLAGSEGGIRISYIGTPDTLIINGGVQDEALGYSAGLGFGASPIPPSQLPPHTKLPEFNSIAELGLMAGAADPMMNFPAGTTFTPFSVLRNVSNAAISLTPTIWWMQAGQARSAQLQPVQLQPYQSQSLNVPSMLALAGIPNYNGSFNIVLNGDLKRGSLITAAGSVDQTKTYVFQIVPRAVAESASKSLQYWSTGNGDDTMITLWNPADEAQDLVFKLIFSGGHYLLPIHLDARATRMINVSEIIMSGVPDAEGNTIPPNVHEGSAKIIGSLADNQHILIAMDAGVYNVRKATCGLICYTCDGFSNWEVSPASFTVDVDGTTQLDLLADYSDGIQYDLSGDATWETNNPSVASVNANQVTGVGAGTVLISAIDDFDPIYTPDVCYEAGWGDPCPVAVGFAADANGTAGDATPVIQSISNTNWYAGPTPNSVTFNGQHFGTNAPALNFSPSSGITYTLSSYGDTQIVANITVPSATPNESVNVTVTNNGYGAGNGFVGLGGQGPTSGQTGVNVIALAAPTPQIWFNGSNVTGTTQTVVVGQQIQLSAVQNLPSGLGATSNNWTIPGSIVGGYIHGSTGALVAPTVSGTAPVFYWITPGSEQVQYSYCMNNGQCSQTVTATFTVEGPTVTFDPPVTGTVEVVGNTRIGFDPSSGDIGVYFYISLAPPNGYSGTIQWAQLVTGFSAIYKSPNVTTTCTFPAYGIDSGYPYSTSIPANDSPFDTITDPTGNPNTETTTSFSAQMFLLWEPSNVPNPIPVPLGSSNWAWNGDATLDTTTNKWSINSGSASANSFVDSATYPTWQTVLTPSSVTCN